MNSLDSQPPPSWLAWALRGILLLGLAILLGRLVELQIIKGEYFQALAEGNRTRRIPIIAPRGKILARGGEVLVGNIDVKKIVEFDAQNGVTKRPAVDGENTKDAISEPVRYYPLGGDFAHAGGYLGAVTNEEVGKVDPRCPQKGPRDSTSLVGRTGLEEQYNCLLRGVNGEEMVEVDTFGHKIRTLGTKRPIPGSDLHTTIDYGLQKKIAEIFSTEEGLPKSRPGGVVVSDGQGQILGFYSSPTFDPGGNISKYLNDASLPLFDRIISGSYHPGSVFKIVTATGALEEGKITRDYTYNDPGIIRINDFSYANWLFTQHGKVEGEINVIRAIARSTDTFFYKVGELLGPENLAMWARRFGYGKPTGIDLPGEVPGLVPDPVWKKETKKENWFLGNTYHMAIGQGDVATTPLEVNMMTGVIANGGYLCRPHMLNTGETKDQNCKKIDIKQNSLDIVRQGMVGACTSGGTAFPFFNFTPQIACKTGTAETQEHGKTHAWFTSFGPVNEEDSSMPTIVVTVLVEKGGEGSEVAAPIAQKIFHYWLYDRNP
jgi:penicillin-binding protein 2